MPSHSAKQHRFMEAIAHSPSFAKKAGVPQSVGKDYAAADKGKTFKKGGDMKRMAGGGQLSEKDYQKSQTKLANMREEEDEVQNERQRRADQERYQSYARGIGMTDLRLAKKEGKTYDKWFEDNRKDQLKKGILRKEAYDEGKGFEMLTPAEHRKAMVSGYKKGGDVKESKAMVGKEVAFMKKKGAPAKMIKHEMSEMKGMKAGGKVRRMAGGGMGDPFELSDEDRANYEKNGAKNLESIKNFFGFGKKKDEEAAPIDRSRDKPPPVIRPSMGGPSTSTETSRVSNQSPRTRREGEDTSASDAVEREDAAARDRTTKGPQYTSSINTDGGEYSGDGFFKPAKESRVSPAKEPTRTRRPATVSRTRETTSVTAEPAKGKVPAKIDSEKLLRDAEEEVLRKKPTAMTEQMRKAPTINDLYKGQKSMGEEIGDVLKGFRESIRGGLQKGKERQESKGSTMYAKGGNVKRMRYGGEPDSSMDMGQPMRGTRMNSGRGVPMQAMGPEMNPNSIAALQAKYGMRPQGGPPMKAGGAVKKMAEGGYAKADGVAKKGKTQPKMVKMASGGFVKNADGCAQRGKTKAFQVKMNRGGKC
jgi:hypothetical protein